MKEIDANREAWSALAEDHYHTFLRRFREGNYRLNAHIRRELPDLRGKRVLHLQCNTGADSICLARMGAKVTGVDFSPENIRFARKLAADVGEEVRFFESEVCALPAVHAEKYDAVFTSEGVLGWLPDLRSWAETVRFFLKEDGFLYLFDSHPFFLMMNGEKLGRGEFAVQYPYFSREPDADDVIGGYASAPKRGRVSYFWMHTFSELFNALAAAGLCVRRMSEFPENFYDSGGFQPAGDTGLFVSPCNGERFPVSYSLLAEVCRREGGF